MAISDGSVQEMVVSQSLETLGPVLAAVDRFTFDTSVDPVKPGAGVLVDFVTGGSGVLKNAADYATGDMNTRTENVIVDKYSKGFGLSDAQINDGHRLERLLGKALDVMATGLRQVINEPLTTANYGTALSSEPADFEKDDMTEIFQAAKGFDVRHLQLEGDYYAKLIPTNQDHISPDTMGAYKMNSISMNNEYGGAEAGVRGFVGGSNSMLLASGEPLLPAAISRLLEREIAIPLPGGLTAYYYEFAIINSFEVRASLQIMLGSKVGDPDAGKLIIDPTP